MELIHETDIVCPHCGEAFPLQVDTSQAEQRLIEDCSVCCRPIVLTIHCRPGEIERVGSGWVRRLLYWEGRASASP